MSRLPLLPGQPRPLLFAHRGLSSLAPENTMAAFRLARDRGVPGVELDVRLCADGVLAVIHDARSSRVAPGQGGDDGLEIRASAWAELRVLDVGAWKGGEWVGERMPRLEELFEELGDAVYYDIELKNFSLADSAPEAALAAALAASPGARLAERVVVSSFNPFALARFKLRAPRIPTAIIWSSERDIPPFLRDGEGALICGADALKPAAAKASPSAALSWRMLRRRPFVPWVVDEPAEAERLLGLGCEGLISNRPQDIRAGSRRDPSRGR